MIHTAKFIYPLSETKINNLLRRQAETSLPLSLDKIDSRFNGIQSNIYYQFTKLYLNISVNFPDMLGVDDIKEHHLSQIEQILSEYASEITGIFDYKLFRLTRLDYKYDCVLPSKERELLFRLCKKAIQNHGHHHKNTDFSTTAYFQSKSVTATVYDKEKERQSQKKTILKSEKDVLRFEVRLKSKHLHNNKHKIGISFDNYFKESIYKKYMSKYFSNFLFLSNYHTFSSASNTVKFSSFNDSTKKKLVDFLLYSSKYTLDRSRKKLGTAKYGRYTKQLESLDIAPILIYKSDLNNKPFFENPLKIFK